MENKNMKISFNFEGMHDKDYLKNTVYECNAEHFDKVCPIVKNSGMPGLAISAGFYVQMHRMISVKLAQNALKDLAPDSVIPRKMAEVLDFVCRNCVHHVR